MLVISLINAKVSAVKITQQVVNTQEMNNEYHIASFVAHAQLEQLTVVEAHIESIEGAEIHAKSPEGKIVFTIEDDSQKAIGRKIDQIKEHSGLLSFSPVYHQYLPEEAQESTQ